MAEGGADIDALAHELLAALDAAARLPLHSARPGGLSVAQAYAAAQRVQALRLARGERPRGWKIGFTNRSIWARYNVYQPMWAPVWDTTLTLLDSARATLGLAGLCQPRLEPEIVFGLARAPQAGMTLDQLRDCVEWAAHGFEVVHTHYDGWRFQAADCALDFGLHGRLLVGPRVPVAGWATLAADLAALRVELLEGGGDDAAAAGAAAGAAGPGRVARLVDSGQGSVVLDGPLHALKVLVESMAATTPHWSIAAGDVVTTGTITDAQPLAPGQRWASVLSDSRLSGLVLDVTG